MTTGTRTTAGAAIGRDIVRLDGPLKVTGTAPYAYERPVAEPLYLFPVRATIARGHVSAIDATDALALHESVRVITHENSMRLVPQEGEGANLELWVLQDDEVHFWGQFVALAVATRPEIARAAAELVSVDYKPDEFDTGFRYDHPDRYRPGVINGASPEPDTSDGDVDAAFAAAPARVDHEYTTATNFHNSIEPGTTVAIWQRENGVDHVTLYDSNQGASMHQQALAPVIGLDPTQITVDAPYVGGAFGAKIRPRPHHVAAILAARATPGRAVKFALTRQQTFTGTTYRTPTYQRVRLAAERDGALTAIAHDVVEQTARYKEFAEQTGLATRTMYAAPNRVTTHRLVPLDVSVPGVMRAPGEAPGMFALESAIDELAIELRMDPIELRVRNEPAEDPETGKPFSSRDVVWCLREGANRFGWAGRDATPRARLVDGWWVGTGVALATYPRYYMPGARARVVALGGGRYRVEIAAADIGTGAWTILRQVAADGLDVDYADVDMQIGSTTLPYATVAGGSAGAGVWSDAVVAATRTFREQFGNAASEGADITGPPTEAIDSPYARHAFGAHFAEVRVDADTGEIRVSRLLGAFDVGRVINPRTARSQLIGGITMGMSMALFEEGVMDPRFGHVVTQDLASYHVAAHADVPDIEVIWLGTPDPQYNAVGSKGLGELGTTGVTAAIANAAWHATGVRVRSLPITADHFIA